MNIEKGSPVHVLDAYGQTLTRVALSGPEPGADFPVVWVCRPEEWAEAQAQEREPAGVPWPLEDVELAPQAAAA